MSETGDLVPVNGFTLIEVLVVMAISGLIAGIAFPAVDRMIARAQFRRVDTNLHLVLSEARASAIRGHGAVTVTMSPDHRMMVRGRPVSDGLPGDVSVQFPERGLTFFADGTATSGEIVIGSARYRKHLFVDAMTGLAGAGT